MNSDAILVGIWAVALYCHARTPCPFFPESKFDYKGFSPKPKLFTAFQFPRL